MQTFTCLICNGNQYQTSDYPNTLPDNELKLTSINICNNCQTGQAIPAPSQAQLDAFYQSGNYWSGLSENTNLLAHERCLSALRVKRALKHCDLSKQLNVLDIGAGNAFIADKLNSIKNNNIHYTFMEPDPELARYNLHKKDFQITIGQIEQFPAAPTYDLIFLNHVLEHVSSPIDFLEHVISSLKLGGTIYIETPHNDHKFKAAVFPHTFFFGKKSFEKIADVTNMSILELKPFGNLSSLKPSNKIVALYQRIMKLMFRKSVDYNLPRLQMLFEYLIHGFSYDADGIWISAILRKHP